MCVIHDTIQTGSINDLSRERNRKGRGFGAVEVWRQTTNVMLQGGSDHRRLYIDRMSSYLFFCPYMMTELSERWQKSGWEPHVKGSHTGIRPVSAAGRSDSLFMTKRKRQQGT